jgi:hypothetical protein
MDTSTALSLRGGDWCKPDDTPVQVPRAEKVSPPVSSQRRLRCALASKTQPKAIKRGPGPAEKGHGGLDSKRAGMPRARSHR